MYSTIAIPFCEVIGDKQSKKNKFYPGRNDCLRRSRYVVSVTTVPSLKAYRILNITQLSLCAAGLILLAGDICPQPGPTFQLNNSGFVPQK